MFNQNSATDDGSRNRPRALVFLQRGHRLNSDALSLVGASLEIIAVGYQDEADYSKEQMGELAPDIVLNFLCEKIHKGSVLKQRNVNFHPASPEYPGRGGASFALFDGKKEYGATTHVMVSNVDSGAILDVVRFPVTPVDTCESLFEKSEHACLELLARMVDYFAKYRELVPSLDVQWTGKAVSRRQFQEWLILDPKRPEEFERKIKAARHSKFPGPYLYVNGHRFGLVADHGGSGTSNLGLTTTPSSLAPFDFAPDPDVSAEQ